ncbi:CCQ_1a_G0013810.mRNA.1.CDS.1 [Saccharomyces cerevisiae]|nr:CCQ_1a_G0013810.mRNA.1.CDS.1 [Saccharomyces cerevisiae]CAI7247047.1 CCQ_1a_G0013810.mRNA.1.CDS.1 [Saccharomyces cerevisiae]
MSGIYTLLQKIFVHNGVCAVKLSASLLGCLLACASWSLLLEVSRIKWHVGTAYS